ncbi:hypothetical protein ACU4HD_14630 [Cupriavidus basilensis]
MIDYDMSLSRLTGRLPVPMIGYQHFSVAHLERENRRKAAQAAAPVPRAL